MKKISILLSCFNGSELIESYIDSIIHPDISSVATLIAIDFPFSHNDSKFVEMQLQRYPDLILVKKEENISLYDVWNEAIQLATTEFVGNLNLDDRVSSNYYKTAFSALYEFTADVYSSFSLMTSEVGKLSADARMQEHITSDRFGDKKIIEYELKDLVSQVCGRVVKRSIPHCAPVWRRSLHDELGFFDSKSFDFCADYEFWLRVAVAKKKMIVSREQQTLFYCANETASDRLIYPENVKIINRWKTTFPPKNYRPTHLGEEHDLLHYCLNMNAIFSSKKYYRHLIDFEQLKLEYGHIIQDDPVKLKEKSGSPITPSIKKMNSRNIFPAELPATPNRLLKFKNCHMGERALLLCNGPSLNKVDFSSIDVAKFTLIGLNKIYLGFDRLGIEPKYIVAINKKVIEQAANEYNNLSIIKFISNRVDDQLVPENDTTFHINTVNLPKPNKRFSEDITAYVHEGWTVTHAALQIFYYMGFAEIYIVGMDHRFSQHVEGHENRESVIKGKDVDHFDPKYFGNGQSWDFPDLANSEISYLAALEAFNRDGRAIFDCTINGKCTIFPKLPIDILYSFPNRMVGNEKFRKATKNQKSYPLISVISPVFNTVKFLYQSVYSVLRQNIMDLELLLVDDGSMDGSLQLANRLAELDDRIHVVRNRHTKGVSGARNTGLEMACGEFVAFLDSDDEFDDGALQTRLKAFELKPEAELVHGSLRFVDPHGDYLGITLSSNKTLSFTDLTGNPASLNTVLGRGKLLTNFSFVEGLTNGEDWLYLATLLRSGVRSHFVEGGGAIYRIHPDSTVPRDINNHERTLHRVIDWIYSDSDDTTVAAEFSKGLTSPPKAEILLRRRLSLFLHFLLVGDRQQCFSMISDPEFLDFMKAQKDVYFRSAMRVPLARVFLICLEATRELPEKIRYRIAMTDGSLKLNRLIPQLHHALSDCFNFRKLKLSISECFGENSIILGSFSRVQMAHWDETSGIAEIFRNIDGPGHIMIDVGAHFGTALAPFLDKGWKIFAFEPDENNCAKLLERLSNHKNKNLVKIDTRAVSNKSQNGLTFYCSEESTGVSGLSAFLPSHEAKQKVDTVRLTEALADETIAAIDFLKIDTEGHDFFVLQGFPWERFKPAVIECEFEDTKTVPLDYTFHDMAGFLADKGYQVYVSEWHPIVRYGIRHNWKCLMRYPCQLTNEKAWGNLLAFRDPIDESVVVEAVKKELKFYGPDGSITKAPPKPQANASSVQAICFPVKTAYAPFAEIPMASVQWKKRNGVLVIGNGSSLRNMEFQRLQPFKSIGMNAAYRHWKTKGIYPNYYICLDTVVIESLKDEIYELIRNRAENGIQLFFLRKKLLDFYPELNNVPEVVFFEDYFNSPYFEGITQGITTGSFATLLGAMLGYKRIYLLGIDLNYVQQIPEARNVKGHVLEMTHTPSKNPNYFFDDYQRKGDRFNIPDSKPDLHYQSWVMVKERLERFGVHVLNCNPDSRLDIFDYADINEVLPC